MNEADKKRCENCKKLFGRRIRQPSGEPEYPCVFKQRRFCSRSCSATANQIKRKMVCEASA